MNHKLQPSKILAALAAFGFSSAFAQTSNPAPAGSTNTREATVELSPFTVTAEQDVGYQAANTLAGSRMNTALRDTPASISILTEEFIRDIAALDMTEAIAFGNNVELELNDGNAAFEFFNTFQIRGQASTVARNYFRWKLPTNTFNVERIEEARGPNSILFGIASAGGLISTSTKQAYTNRDFRKAQLIYGSFDLRRASFDINHSSFDDRLGIRVNAVVSKENGFQHFVFNKDNRVHLAVKYNLTPNTVIRGEYEKGQTRSNKADRHQMRDGLMRWVNAGRQLQAVPATNAAMGITRQGTGRNLSVFMVEEPGGIRIHDMRGMGIAQSLSNAVVTDPAIVDSNRYQVSVGGPGQVQNSDFDTYSASIEHKVGKDTFLQLAYNHQNYDFEAWQASSSNQLKADPNMYLADDVTPNPHAGELYLETYWTQRLREEELDNLRFTASTEFDFGNWGEYRFAGLAEREWSNWSKDNFNEAWATEDNLGAFTAITNGSANRAWRRHYVTEGDDSTFYASGNNPSVAGFMSGVVDPSDPSRTLKTRLARSSGSDFNDPQEQDSYLLAGQAYYFKRRLVLSGGYRTDTLYLHEGARNLRNANMDFVVDNENNPRTDRTIKGNTRTYGAVYHVLPWISLRYNRSNSLELANVGVRLMPESGIGSRVGDNPQGEGEDIGIDLNLLDGKIYVRATYFETARVGAQRFTYGGGRDSPSVLSNRVMDTLLEAGEVSLSERDQHRPDTGGSNFDVASSGYEFSVTANPTRNWRLQANYSITDSVTDNVAPEIQAWAAREIPYFQTFDQTLLTATGLTIGDEIARWQAENATNRSIEGVNTIGARRHKVSGVTRYSFSEGALKGFHIGGAARHQDKQVVGFNTITQSLVFGSSFTRIDGFLGYRFGKVSWLPFLEGLSVQLNVMNVMDKHDPLITAYVNVNAPELEIARQVPQLPRTWRLTVDLEF